MRIIFEAFRQKIHENPLILRYGNLILKNVLILVILICTIGAYWKRRHVKKPMAVSGRVNVFTLSQTVTLLTLFSFDNTLLSFVISSDNVLGMSNELVFNLEMLRVIFIENLFFKFLVPLYLLHNTGTNLPSLWAERNYRNQDFFMTVRNLTPRQVISRYQVDNERDPEGEERGGSSSTLHVLLVRKSCVDVPMDLPDVQIH